MAKPSIVKTMQSEEKVRDTDFKYTGVRKRKWGKWVSEIRLPNSRERIWLGSYDSAEKAARAFDAAQFCLRGSSARLNFPGSFPEIPDRHLTHEDVHTIATRFANSGPLAASRAEIPSEISLPTVTVSECSSDVTSLIRFKHIPVHHLILSRSNQTAQIFAGRFWILWWRPVHKLTYRWITRYFRALMTFLVITTITRNRLLNLDKRGSTICWVKNFYYGITNQYDRLWFILCTFSGSIANFGDGPDFMVFLCPATETAAN